MQNTSMENQKPEKPRRDPKNDYKVFAAIIAFCLAIVGWYYLGGGQEREAQHDQEVLAMRAQRACEQFTKDQLKAPSTAEFSNWVTTEITDRSWRIKADVDAQNSFGAMIRNTTICEISYNRSSDEMTGSAKIS